MGGKTRLTRALTLLLLTIPLGLVLYGDEPVADQPPLSITLRPDLGPTIFGKGIDFPGNEPVERAMRQIIDIRISSAPIRLVAKELERILKVPVRIDEDSSGNGINPEMQVTCEAYGVPVSRAITLLDGPTRLGGVIKNGKLVFWNADAASEARYPLLYDINSCSRIGQDWLIELIKEYTSGPWDEDEPGTGIIRVVGGSLLVTNTHLVHREIEWLLQSLSKNVVFPNEGM
jgi:hypothetical protein